MESSKEHSRTERRDLHVGDLVGDRYRLRRELGRGGVCVVFEAQHVFTERSAALKAISAAVPPSQLVEQSARLLREARALASIRHAGVVEILDGGKLEDGTPFIVLEKLDGRTLEGLVATRLQLPVDDTVAIGLQLCDALDAMHRAGVIHRDIKPGNIFLLRDRDGSERVKLLDFGIASVERVAEARLTEVGGLLGTPTYMSREQLLGLEVDLRTDIYSLGVTLFECLTGRVPYDGTYPQVLLRVSSPKTKPPRIADYTSGVPRELSDVIERATQHGRDQRFATAADFGRALYEARPQAHSKTSFLGPGTALPRFAPPASTQEKPPAQRRNAPRASYATPVQLATSAGSTVDGRSEDISESGMLFLCRSSIETGGHVTVRFALPIDGKVATCAAEVRWVRAARPEMPEGPRAVGLEFVNLEEPMRAAISRYVSLMGTQ